ncbi:hypothetical protein EGV77_24935 [Salmonella enterica subsp. enterica]|nr:hypothetical protein [Salmonella enterica subsp. enterica]ECO4189907.1 hypothetical protein [Salmonella enterica]
MSQYNKTVRMLFGVIAFLLFSKVSIMLGTTGWKDVCFLIGCYLFLYFFIFSLIDSAVGNISSFQNGNISITTKQTPLTASNEDVEGYDVKAIITIKVRNEEKHLDMSGYCGV